MMWEKVRLEDCCYSISDGDHQPPPKAQQGIPFVTISNINSMNQLDFSDTMFVPKEYYQSLDEKRKVRKGDVLYSVVGSFGIPVLIKEERPFVFQRHIAILRPKEDIVDSGFLFYTMLNRDFYAKADAVAIGAAQRTVSLGSLRNIKIDVPSLESQKHIADILSAYDDLIENNQKQIKLLEEAAQRLYKEWFVDLRFPGHENTKIVDGVPEGWHWGLLQELINVNYGKDHKKAPESGDVSVYGSGGLMRKCNKSLFSGEAVLIPRKGSLNNIMYVDETFWTVDTMFYATMKQPHTAIFVYFFVKSFDMYSMNIGAAVPSMTTKILDAMNVLIPKDEILGKFDKQAKVCFDKIKTLQRQNEQLRKARDLLLPKLMSGEAV